LVVHISRSLPSFVQKDIEILESEFPVKTFYYAGRSDIPALASKVLRSSITLSWFSWDQAAWAVRFSRLIGKPSVVIIGGFDVVKMPEISYGNLLSKRSANRTKYAISKSTKAIAVSRSIRDDAMSLSGRSDIDVVYHGFDSERFKPEGEKQDLVLTVGDVNESNMRRKGLLAFLKAARLLPEVRFAMVGRVADLPPKYEKLMTLPNLDIPGYVSIEALMAYMHRAKAYVQVSGHEGFGCSLAEAMLCECAPVVTSRGALPEVVGDTGAFVPFDDPSATADAITSALEDESSRRKARDRIKTEFPLEKRKNILLGILRGLT
jgi:glycosyltransferase involved in cell wall biosynthesis